MHYIKKKEQEQEEEEEEEEKEREIEKIVRKRKSENSRTKVKRETFKYTCRRANATALISTDPPKKVMRAHTKLHCLHHPQE